MDKKISYKHIMPNVLKIKNSFKGAVVISILVTDSRIIIINARKPSSDDLDIVEEYDEPNDKDAIRYMG